MQEYNNLNDELVKLQNDLQQLMDDEEDYQDTHVPTTSPQAFFQTDTGQ